MKKIFIQKALSLVLMFTLLVMNMLCAQAGAGHSKPKSYFTPEQLGIMRSPRHLPYYAEDGGKAYFNAWNGINEGYDFNLFTHKFSRMIENGKPATELKDSSANYNWSTGPVHTGCFAIRRLEEYPKDEYFLRVDYESRIIYTIRKSGHTYLCTFYILYVNPKEIKINIAYRFVISAKNNVKNLLLPVDKRLLDEN